MKSVRVLFSLLALLCTAEVFATPQVVRIDGTLFDQSGKPVVGVTSTVQVSAYSAATGGSALWTSGSYSVVPSNGGRFTLNLDTSVSGGLFGQITSLGSTAGLWFEFSYNSTAVLPRLRARGSLFALSAANSSSLRNSNVSTTAPTNGYALSWNHATSQWEPTNLSGSGGIGSIAMTVPSPLSVTGSPITTTGVFDVSFAAQSPNTVLMGATSGSVAPSFRSLVAGDLPASAVALNKGGTNSTTMTAVTGAVVFSNASALTMTAQGTAGQALVSAGAATPVWSTLLGVTAGGTGATTQQAALNALAGTSGVTVGDVLYSDGTNWTRLARGTTGQVIKSTAGSVAWGSGTYLPSGAITMWSGSLGSIPSGWVLCDGTNGTPDLRNRFLIGAGGTRSPGDTGGAATHTHTVNSTFTGNANSHTHTASSSFSGSASTHTHTVTASFTGTATTLVAPPSPTKVDPGGYVPNSAQDINHSHSYTPAGTVAVTLNNASLTATGSVTTTPSTDSVTPTGTISTSLTSNGTLPPYYALMFIMKQ